MNDARPALLPAPGTESGTQHWIQLKRQRPIAATYQIVGETGPRWLWVEVVTHAGGTHAESVVDDPTSAYETGWRYLGPAYWSPLAQDEVTRA